MTTVSTGLGTIAATAREVLKSLDTVLPRITEVYTDLHSHPELSGHEVRTSSVVAEQLREAGAQVSTGVGGHGVVGVVENGPGPVVAVRADMDALPMEERTGLPYSSEEVVANDQGVTVPVAHACGHDVHMASLIGTVAVLSRMRASWSGKLLAIGQPAEETFKGAAAMLADGLFTRFPRPDMVLGQHVCSTRAGTVSHRLGAYGAGVRNFRVHIRGKGAHGAMPHQGIDPIVTAAEAVTMMQSVVTREIDPRSPAVLTVGSFHSGTRPNIIPDDTVLEITTRAAEDEILNQLEDGLRRTLDAACAGRGAPAPEVELIEHVYPTVNDIGLTSTVRAMHEEMLGSDNVVDFPAMGMGSEDFSLYGRPGPDRYSGDAIPTCYWGLGGSSVDQWENAAGDSFHERAANIPNCHSSEFAPDREAALRSGVTAMTSAAVVCLIGSEGNDSTASGG